MEEEVGWGGVREDDFVSVDVGDGVSSSRSPDGCEEQAVVVERRDASWIRGSRG
jgi:hypothetical protein